MFSIAFLFLLNIILYLKTGLKGRFHKNVFIAFLLTLIGFIYFYFTPRYTEVKSSVFFYVVPQIYLIRAFYLDFKSAPALDKSGARIAIALTFALSIGYYLLVRSTLGILRLPFMIGLFCSSFLIMMAYFRNQRVNKQSFNMVLSGILLLVFSEAFFAYHTFNTKTVFGENTYAITSLFAYALIIWGSIKRKLIYPEGIN